MYGVQHVLRSVTAGGKFRYSTPYVRPYGVVVKECTQETRMAPRHVRPSETDRTNYPTNEGLMNSTRDRLPDFGLVAMEYRDGLVYCTRVD